MLTDAILRCHAIWIADQYQVNIIKICTLPLIASPPSLCARNTSADHHCHPHTTHNLNKVVYEYIRCYKERDEKFLRGLRKTSIFLLLYSLHFPAISTLINVNERTRIRVEYIYTIQKLHKNNFSRLLSLDLLCFSSALPNSPFNL